MKTIGLIGGMSWESTVTYYQEINEKIKENLGGLNSAKIIMHSVNFAEIEKCQLSGDWDKCADILGDIAISLEKAGADFILICTNTMHKVVPQIQPKVSIPFIHIAEATAEKLKEEGITKVGLLGTRYTMTQEFYKDKLIDSGICVVIPNEEDIETVNHIIFKELCVGIVKEESKQKYIEIINKLVEQGAQGIILGCTEIGLLINQDDVDVKIFDTTLIHSEKAVQLALGK